MNIPVESPAESSAVPRARGLLSKPVGGVRARSPSPGPGLPSKPSSSPRHSEAQAPPSPVSPSPVSPPPSRSRGVIAAATVTEAPKEETGARARMIIQQMESVSYLAAGNHWTDAGQGYILYVSFMKKCDENVVRSMAEAVFNCNNLENTPEGPRVSIQDFEGSDVDLLIIPQASLAGRLKGSAMQYHSLAEKSDSRYFFELLKTAIGEKACAVPKKVSVLSGSWGCRQEIKLQSSGPNTILLEF